MSQTPVAGLRRVDVRVRRESDAPESSLVSLAGFIGATATSTGPSPTPWNAGQAGNGGNGDGDGET